MQRQETTLTLHERPDKMNWQEFTHRKQLLFVCFTQCNEKVIFTLPRLSYEDFYLLKPFTPKHFIPLQNWSLIQSNNNLLTEIWGNSLRFFISACHISLCGRKTKKKNPVTVYVVTLHTWGNQSVCNVSQWKLQLLSDLLLKQTADKCTNVHAWMNKVIFLGKKKNINLLSYAVLMRHRTKKCVHSLIFLDANYKKNKESWVSKNPGVSLI